MLGPTQNDCLKDDDREGSHPASVASTRPASPLCFLSILADASLHDTKRPRPFSSASNSSASGKGSYKCKKCGRMYASTDACRKHARQTHAEWLKEKGHGCPSLYCTVVEPSLTSPTKNPPYSHTSPVNSPPMKPLATTSLVVTPTRAPTLAVVVGTPQRPAVTATKVSATTAAPAATATVTASAVIASTVTASTVTAASATVVASPVLASPAPAPAAPTTEQVAPTTPLHDGASVATASAAHLLMSAAESCRALSMSAYDGEEEDGDDDEIEDSYPHEPTEGHNGHESVALGLSSRADRLMTLLAASEHRAHPVMPPWLARVNSSGKDNGAKVSVGMKRPRSVRCGQCEGCVNDDCGTCKNCVDKPKFGGLGMRKQGCVRKICSAPRTAP